MSMRIEVKRVRNTLSYIPECYVGGLPDDAKIISIIDEGGRRPEFKPTQTVLPLESGVYGLANPDYKAAGEFLAAHLGENIYIHCWMGQIRSKNLAEHLALRNSEYVVMRHSTDCVTHTYYKD